MLSKSYRLGLLILWCGLLSPWRVEAQIRPAEQYPELFQAVQLASVFPDSKTFADCTPLFPIEEIQQKYQTNKNKPDFDLKAFVEEHFQKPISPASGFQSDANLPVEEHINRLWPILTREPDSARGSLIPLPYPYIVPGGRFGEIYYWDSFFTMLGLQTAGKTEMIENMVNNFAHLIDQIGFIPNGTRTYYLGRSQPPFFAQMVGLLAEEKGDSIYIKYLPQLEKEYNFWMKEPSVPKDNTAFLRMIRLPDGSILNRYWDNIPEPRPESYKEDVELAEKSGRAAKQLYRNLRAACESGWDFSSRWLRDGKNLASIHTTEIIPVDLNCLLYGLEMTLAQAYEIKGNAKTQQARYEQAAQARKAAILQYNWDEAEGFFTDYDFVAGRLTKAYTGAGVFPLYFQLATPEQAKAVAEKLEKDFLKPGGLLSALANTGQQWDAPNGWAPLQWMAIQGLRNYGFDELADQIKKNWTALNMKVYKNTGKLVEKYNVMDMSLEAGGGEYPVQDGFGWTNGVLLRLLAEE